MNETETKENSAGDLTRLRSDIDRLFQEGYSNQEMADELNRDCRVIARNLRELKKRWARAAARQKSVLSQTQCATVYREAMDGWRRSQNPKLTTTEQKDPEKEAPKTTTRRSEGPGDKTFLQAAVAALKALRQFAADSPPGSPAAATGDAEYLALLQVLTPEQLENLNHEQLRRIRSAVDAFRSEVDAHRNQPGRCQDQPAGLHPAHAAELPGELAPPDAGADAGPRGGGGLPAADGLHAAAARQERTGEPPLPGLHAGPRPGVAADRGQPHP